MATSRPKHNRQSILQLKEMAHVQEALIASAEAQQRAGKPFDIFRPIRETPLSVFFDRSNPNGFEEGKLNPNLPTIWKHRYGIRIGDEARGNMRIGGKELRETVSIPNTLSALKIADEILEGAEPWSDWKQYARLIDMDAPKVNVPLTKYTDTVGGDPNSQKGLDIYTEAGGTPPAIGGKVTTVELDTSGTNNSFRGTISVNRNDVKDNNFLSVEQSLKNAGNEFYFMVGKKIIDVLVNSTAVPTATKAQTEIFAGKVEGVFEVAKLTANTWAAGDKVNWNDSNKEFQLATSDLDNAGTVVEAATSSVSLGKVRLTPV